MNKQPDPSNPSKLDETKAFNVPMVETVESEYLHVSGVTVVCFRFESEVTVVPRHHRRFSSSSE